MPRPLALLFLIGCAANNGDGGMIILNNSAAPVDSCAFTPSANEAFIASGQLFLFSPTPYLLTPLIQSKITAVMGTELQHTIEFRGAKIDLSVGTMDSPIRVRHADGSENPYTFTTDELGVLHDQGTTHFKSLFSGSLPPDGFANVAFDIVPVELLDAISQKIGADVGTVNAVVVATIVPYGDIGGDEVDGDTFVYPVTVCTDCIVNPLGPCPLPTGSTISLGNACNPFQDGVVDCCTSGTTTICPATVMM